jgi:hypothetical protein
MKSRHLVFWLLATALTASGGAFADSIYKWTDAEGNIHYGDRPSGAEAEVRMNLTYSRTDNSAVEQRIQTRHDKQAARSEAAVAAAEKETSAEEKRAEAAQQQKQCESYSGKLESLLQARRLYREDENGERVYLDDSARMDARERLEDLVQESCNS